MMWITVWHLELPPKTQRITYDIISRNTHTNIFSPKHQLNEAVYVFRRNWKITKFYCFTDKMICCFSFILVGQDKKVVLSGHIR